MSINKVVISGNLTRDPELRETAAGGIAVTPTGKKYHKELKKMQ